MKISHILTTGATLAALSMSITPAFAETIDTQTLETTLDSEVTNTSTMDYDSVDSLSSSTLDPETSQYDLAAAPTECKDLDIVIAAGTGEASQLDDPNEIYGLRNGINFVKTMIDTYDNVSAWQVPYTASVGIAGSLGKTHTNHALPYGASRQTGINAAVEHITSVHAACANTKFMTVGFSQGSTVAGDVAAMISHGDIAGIDDSYLVASYLIADPGRSALTGNTTTTDSGASGLESNNGEVLIPLDQSVPLQDKTGLTGARSESFAPGKVMSFCHNNDVACSTQTDGIAQRVGKAMNETLYNPLYNHVGRGIKDFGTAAGPNLTALAWEIGVVNSIVKNYDGQTPEYDGADLAGFSSTLAVAAQPIAALLTSPNVAHLLPHLINMMPHHLAYFSTAETTPWTIGGTPVDEWIQADMQSRIEAL